MYSLQRSCNDNGAQKNMVTMAVAAAPTRTVATLAHLLRDTDPEVVVIEPLGVSGAGVASRSDGPVAGLFESCSTEAVLPDV